MMRLVTLALVTIPTVLWFVREYRREATSAADEAAAELLAELDDTPTVAAWLGVQR